MRRLFQRMRTPLRFFSCTLAIVWGLPAAAVSGELMDTVTRLESEVGGRIGVVLQHTGSEWGLNTGRMSAFLWPARSRHCSAGPF